MVIAFDDSTSNNTWDIAGKNWRPKEIGFFDLNCEEPGPVVIINCHIYYWDIYVFIAQLKNIVLLGSIEKTWVVLL